MPKAVGSLVVFAVLVACSPKPETSSGAGAPIQAVTVGAVPSATSAPPPEEKPPEEEPEPPPPIQPPPVSTPEAAACVRDSKLSHCLPRFGATMDAPASLSDGAECTASCIADRDTRLKPTIGRAVQRCVDAYVKNKGKAPVKCEFPKVALPRDPRELSMRFQDALRAAVEKHDEASVRALDKMLESLDAKYLAGMEPECTRKCREDGASSTSKR